MPILRYWKFAAWMTVDSVEAMSSDSQQLESYG